MSESTPSQAAQDPSALQGEADRYLLEGLRRGEQAALGQLVDRYTGRLLAYAGRRLHGTGIEPEDVVQETFLGLLQSLERLEGVRSLQAYLFQILRHKMYDLGEKRPEAHGMHAVPIAQGRESDAGGRGYEPSARTERPSGHARRTEALSIRDRVLADILEEAIGVLREEKSFRDLKILELLFLSDLSNRDIARLVGTSEPTVTRAKQWALDFLARAARRHPLSSQVESLLGLGTDESDLIRRAWSANLLSCLKRSTLGAYALGALDLEWSAYVAFHLETVGCEFCAANLADLRREVEPLPPAARQRLFTSSVGFLRKLGKG